MKLTTNIQEILEALKRGGVVVYPTETTYGIGCDATNVAAVARVFAIKHRPEGKGVTVLLPASDIFGDRYVTWQSELYRCASNCWPGALNIILPVRADASISVQCLTNGTLAVRRSSHPVANALVDVLGSPLVSTSANISGEPELYSAQDIFERFSRESLQPDLIFDAGTLPSRPPSTLISWDAAAQKINVLRQGEIRID